MVEPVVTVEVEFTAGVWTDVSAYLKTGSTRRGKSRATDKLGPGSATFTMRNELRTFDNEYAGSISPGNIVPDRNIRAIVDYNGTDYPLFTGQIDRVIQRYKGPNESIAYLRCSDALAKLSQDTLASPWVVNMALYPPRAWYRLDEKQGLYAADQVAGRHGSYHGTPGYGAASMTRDGSSINFDTAEDFILIPTGAIPSGPNWQISFLFQMPVKPAVGTIQFLLFSNYYPNGLTMWIDSNGRLNVRVIQPSGAMTYVRSGGFFGDISASSSPVGGTLVTVQSVAIGPPYLKILSGGIDITDAASFVGLATTLPEAFYAIGGTGVPYRIDEFATFDSLTPAAALQDLAGAAEGWLVDDANIRIGRVLDAAGWPSGARDITTDWDTFLRQTDLQTTALEHLEAIVATAEGRMFVERDGTLRILSRGEHVIAPYTTSQGTFGDGAGELPYDEMGDYSLDTDSVENVVRRLWELADSGEYLIEASDVQAGDRRRAGDVIESEYTEANYEADLAQLRASRLSRPRPYVEGLKISPRKAPASLFPQVLGRELGDRITWKRRPQNVGAAISRDVIIEGIGHDFGPKMWETMFFIDATDATNYFRFDATAWNSTDWRFFA